MPRRAAADTGAAPAGAKQQRGGSKRAGAQTEHPEERHDGTEMHARMETMLAWIRAAGVKWRDDELCFQVASGTGGSGGGVMVSAKKDLEPRMGLANIPKSACLSVLNVRAVHSRLDKFDLDTDYDIALAAAITHEILLGVKSRWHGYLSSLAPEGESVPVLWDDGDLQLLAGTHMAEEVEQDRQRFAYYWSHHVRPLLEEALGKKRVPDGAAFRAFLRAVSYSNSRGFYVDERHGEAMVPFADLFNHKAAYLPLEYDIWTQEGDPDDEEELSLDMLDDDDEGDVDADDRRRLPGMEQSMCLASSTSPAEADSLVVGLLRPVPKGSEVFNTYGEHGNAHLLANYGFTLPDNLFDQIQMPALLGAAEAAVGKARVRVRLQWIKALDTVTLPPALRRLPARTHRAALVGFMLKRRHGGVCSVGARVFSVLAALSDAQFAQVSTREAPGAALEGLVRSSQALVRRGGTVDAGAGVIAGAGGGGGRAGGGRAGGRASRLAAGRRAAAARAAHVAPARPRAAGAAGGAEEAGALPA